MDLNRNAYIQIILTSILFSFSFAPSPFGFFIFFAFVPFLHLLKNSLYPDVIWHSYITGLLINMVLFYWHFLYNVWTAIGIIFLNPLQWVVFAVIFRYFSNKFGFKPAVALFPFIWTFLEYSRQWGDLAMGWLNIAYSLHQYIYLIQFADITGFLGLVLWICLINMMIFKIIHDVKFRKVFIISLFFFIPMIYGIYKVNTIQQYPVVRISAVQPNINSYSKWSADSKKHHFDSMFEFAPENSSLMIWPETAIPFVLENDSAALQKMKAHNFRNGVPILSGTLGEKHGRLTNSAVLMDNGKISGKYAKLNLVPIAEGLPFEGIIGFGLADSSLKNFLIEGTEHTVFEISGEIFNAKISDSGWDFIDEKSENGAIRFGVLICYESIFPSQIRQYIENDADFIAVITNDDWFGYSYQPFQHIAVNKIRAIESRTSIVQSANTGKTSFIDILGREYRSTGLYSRDMVEANVPLRISRSVYTQWGDWPGLASIIVIVVFFMLSIIKTRRLSN